MFTSQCRLQQYLAIVSSPCKNHGIYEYILVVVVVVLAMYSVRAYYNSQFLSRQYNGSSLYIIVCIIAQSQITLYYYHTQLVIAPWVLHTTHSLVPGPCVWEQGCTAHMQLIGLL